MNQNDIELFLSSVSIKAKSRYQYRSVLKPFYAAVFRERINSEDDFLLAVKYWGSQLGSARQVRSAIEQSSVFDRFMKWMVDYGRVTVNPFDALKGKYRGGVRGILLALLSENADIELTKLRKSPKYGSFLGAQIRNCIQRHRALGYRYNTHETVLLRFDRYLQTRPELQDKPFAVIVKAWSDSNEKLDHKYAAQCYGRVLSKDLRRIDPSIPPIMVDATLKRRMIRAHRKPYIFSTEEIDRLMSSVLLLSPGGDPLRPQIVFLMIIFAYCLGMRIGEITRLTLNDLNLEEGTLEVKGSKFFKSRRIPLPTSVLEAVREFLTTRISVGAPTVSNSPLFWCRATRKGYAINSFSQIVTKVLRAIGIKPKSGRIGPRIHDLRHSFAVHRMIDWYRNGISPQSQLAQLATYMGHVDIKSTLTYLTLTPELAYLVSERFREHAIRFLSKKESQS
jgi:integrase